MDFALTANNPEDLRRELQENDSDSLRRRRTIIGASLAGMAAMGAVSLLQTGMVRHLPDPPLRGFDSDKVNSSDTAYALGVPDGTVSFASFAVNVPLAACGGADRARTMPWLPLAIAGKAMVEALVAAWYFYQMPAKEKAWCGYCIAGAAMNVAVAGLALPEAREALRTLRDQRE
jgi:uncharacterized membrane protein